MSTPAALARVAKLVQPRLRAVVGELVGRPRQASEYHFGWTDEHGNAVDVSAGKGVRPALAVLGAEAVGADIDLSLIHI